MPIPSGDFEEGWDMAAKTFYNEIITEHNMRPLYKRKLPTANFSLEGINPSCGDEIVLNLEYKDGVIEAGSFEGSGCAISQASADMMLDLIIGKKKEEALRLTDIFLRMIKNHVTEEELAELEEASVLEYISRMPARVKCAVLGWRTLQEILEDKVP